jgi:hypothetical protein
MMGRISLEGIGRAAGMLAMGILIGCSIALGVLLVSGHKLLSSAAAFGTQIDNRELLIVSQSEIFEPGNVVVFSDGSAAEGWQMGRIGETDPASGRIKIEDNQGRSRLLAPDKLFGAIRWHYVGLGGWLEWLSKPGNLLMGFVLPVLAVIVLEFKYLATSWATNKRYINLKSR